jgi:hypothetical protein
MRVSQKGHLFLYCSFLFVRPKRNEPKKKGAGNDNFNPFWQNTLGITLPKKVEVRAISGLPAHDPLEIPFNNYSKVLKKPSQLCYETASESNYRKIN